MTTLALTAERSTSPWPARLAFATWLSAIPLLLFGGAVTSLDAGMTIDGWWVLEPGRGDHFLLFYPVEKWFRDIGTFSEHTHRLFGVLVGNLAIVTLIATWMTTRAKGARWMAFAALLSVCVQGLLGGTRVLENSPELAFLHGALAQIVFAILAASAVVLSPPFQGSTVDDLPASKQLARFSSLAVLATYSTIFAGAWLRHAFSHAALGVHILAVILAVTLTFMLCSRLKACSNEVSGKSKLRRAARNLHALLGLQILLGIASFWIVVIVAPDGPADVHHSAYPTLHVLFGAMVLAQLLVTWLWTRRTLEGEA